MMRCFAFVMGAAFVAAGFSGCQSMGGGTPTGQAQVTVSNVGEAQIEAKTEDVFFRHGFDFKGTGDGHMEFERPGGAVNNVLYGNWQGNDTSTKVTVYIMPKGATTFALRARSMVVRHPFGGDSDTELFDIQGARYQSILDKIAKELNEESKAQ